MNPRVRSGHLFAIPAIAFFAFFSVDARAEGANNPPPAEQKPAEQQTSTQQKPAARREDVEPKTLGEAVSALKEARSDRDKAETDLEESKAAHTKTRELLATTLESAKKANAERDEAKSQLGTVTAERDKERTDHTATKERMTHLEALCDVKGVEPGNAVPAAKAPAAGKLSYADWDKKVKAATGAERSKIMADFEKAVLAGEVSGEFSL
jgi:chromosome segregation ATPase